MPLLSDRDKRALRLGATALAIYLGLFAGYRLVATLERSRDRSLSTIREAQNIHRELVTHQNSVLKVEKLRKLFQLDAAKLSRTALVGQASAAIQTAATSSGLVVGPIRESPARSTSRELSTMQLEMAGPAPALLGMLRRLPTLGFPLFLDAVQISQDPAKPGLTKLNLTIVILDFERWKTEEKTPDA